MLKRKLNETLQIDDLFLLKEIERGCKQSFDLLYEKYWEDAYKNAYIRLKDAEQAKDIIQEIFAHVWIKRETLQIENFPAYLNVAVRNRVIKSMAREKHSHPFFRLLENIPELQSSSDANILTKEFLSAYEAVINTLPAKKQMIFRLRYQEDLSTKDIATHLRLSRKTVQNQLGKAIEALRPTFFFFQIALLSLYYF